jgi:hypothetical protein
VPTEASGWRSSVRRSIARLVPQPMAADIEPRCVGE